MPITLPELLTMLAARNTSIPAPEPRSTTVSPSLTKANFVGVPHPAPRIDACGIDLSSLASYPTSSETCAGDCAGCRTVLLLLLSEQQPPSLPSPTEGPQQESPIRATFAYLFFTISFIFCELNIEDVYQRNYLSCQEKLGKVSVVMETNVNSKKPTKLRVGKVLPILNETCSFEGYDPDTLMRETAKLRGLITKRGTLEILIPLCCTTDSVRYIKFRSALKGFSSKTLAARLKELQKNEILERKAYNEIPPRVEYRLTPKGQELVESVNNLFQWLKKWSASESP